MLSHEFVGDACDPSSRLTHACPHLHPHGGVDTVGLHDPPPVVATQSASHSQLVRDLAEAQARLQVQREMLRDSEEKIKGGEEALRVRLPSACGRERRSGAGW